MIENPHTKTAERRARFPQLIDGEPDDDVLNMKTRAGRIRARRLLGPEGDPTRFDREVDEVLRRVETRVIDLDVKLMEGGHVRHYRNAEAFLKSPLVKRRVARAREAGLLGSDEEKAAKRLLTNRMQVRLRESDFELGLYPDEVPGTGKVFPVTDVVLPTLNSPHSKQMLFVDYLDMHRKCLVFNTLVPLVDGTEVTIQALAERGGEVWVYACKDGMVVPAKAHSARFTGHRETVEVVLDSGESVTATADHPFMLRDGTFRDAGTLKPGDRLMPLYRRLSHSNPKGYEQVYHPALDLWESTHHLVARVIYPDAFFAAYSVEDPRHIDHVNENKRDNRPENLAVLTRTQHFRKTARHPERLARFREMAQCTRAARAAKIAEAQKRTWQDPAVRERRLAGMRANNHRVVAVRPAGVQAVYDLTVPGYENFAVGAGVFVHNCFEAAHHNPIAKRIVKIVPQFVLGRGVKGSIDSQDHQAAWDDFWKRNKMKFRLKQTLKELLIYGEVFWRFFPSPQGLLVRSIDPSTIWDIVTDEDDLEAVKYYHQQYVRLDMSPVPGRVPLPSTLIIRQIPAAQVDHYKINATSSEKRGRSELFSILGYLLRFKEFVNDRILLNKMRAMFALDVKVTGDETDVQAAENQFSTPPGPAAALVHNDAVEVEFKNANTNANDASTDAETILKVIAIGAGVSENFLGVARAQTRAGALISTEPDVKNFEDYQELLEELLIVTAERVFTAKRLSTERVMEFTFPSIAQEDRSAKLKDIAFSESMDYFAKQRAATMAAREFQISDYDFAREQDTIRKERAGDPVIAQGLQQMPKVAPAEPGGDQPGLGLDMKPPKERVTQTSGQMGFKDDLGGRGLPNTQATLNRPGFTRGGEKIAIKNNRTSGTPLRHAGGDEPVKRGWSPEARAASLRVRQERARQRREQQG